MRRVYLLVAVTAWTRVRGRLSAQPSPTGRWEDHQKYATPQNRSHCDATESQSQQEDGGHSPGPCGTKAGGWGGCRVGWERGCIPGILGFLFVRNAKDVSPLPLCLGDTTRPFVSLLQEASHFYLFFFILFHPPRNITDTSSLINKTSPDSIPCWVGVAGVAGGWGGSTRGL